MWLHMVDLSAQEFGFEALAFLCSDKGGFYNIKARVK